MSHVSEFREVMIAQGLNPPEVIEPDVFCRFPAQGKANGNRAGWCKLFFDERGGVFGDWSIGLSKAWRATREKPLTKAEAKYLARQVTAAKKQAEAARRAEHMQVAEQARKIWEAAKPAPDSHQYLVRKAISANGSRAYKGDLVISVGAGSITSLQFIKPSGEKRFLPGGEVAGGCFAIGNPDDAKICCIAEGFSTAASIHEATGRLVLVAFSAGNLLAVAKRNHELFPERETVLCADDDWKTPGNPGLTAAREAALAVNGLIAVPTFADDRPDEATDFNDMAAAHGLEAVKREIESAVAAPMADAQAEKESAAADVPEANADVVARLASLHPLEYEQIRETEAKNLGVRVSVLDKEVANARRDTKESCGKAAMFPAVEPWSQPVLGQELLDEIRATIHQFIVCDREIAIATSLWIVFTWLVDSVQVAPLLVITAPEKRCGKSLLLNLIGKLSRRPLVASNISPAATFRVIEAHCPTLLIDEADSFFKENEELRGVVNSGHTRQSAYVIRTVGDDHEPRQFSTWGAKAISGIGQLADTVMDRAIVLELRRKLPTESVQRLRHAEPGLFERLASMLARFADDVAADIFNARPNLPESLNDRAQDNWEPLLAIADVACGAWPELARNAALRLSGVKKSAASTSTELLIDIRSVFEAKGNKIFTADMVAGLCEDTEKSWATYNRGKPITPKQLSKRLATYGIASKQIRIGYDSKKGFEQAQFEDVFARYLTPSNSPPDFAETTKQNPATPASPGFSDVSADIALNETSETRNNDVSFADNCFETRNSDETRKPAPVLGCINVSGKAPPADGDITNKQDREEF